MRRRCGEGTAMARTISSKKPKNLGFTLHMLFRYMGRHLALLLLVALLVTVSSVAGLLGTYMIRPIVNELAGGNRHTLLLGVLEAGGIFLVGVVTAYGYTQLTVRMAQKVLFDIRRDLFAHVQKLPLRFFDATPHGDVMSYFTNDVDTVADALNNSFSMTIQSFIQIAGTLVILYVLNWRLSLVVTLCYLVMFLYIRYSGRHSKKYYDRQQKQIGALDGYIEETVTGQKVVKVFNHEAENLAAFREKNEALRRAGTGAQSYAATMVPAVVSISYVNYAIVAVLGGIMAMQGLTDVGSLASYLVFVRQAAAPINQFTQQSNFLLAALAGAERIFEVLRMAPEPDEGGVTLVHAEERDGVLRETEAPTKTWAWRKTDGTLQKLCGDVRFADVTFGYRANHPILQHVSLYAKPGQKIAFVGATGAGKTTITNLINRFYDVQGGSVLYDGIDVRDIRKDDLRRSLGIVLQDTHLFTGTIADNIRFGKPGATMEEIEQAARIASADSFIRRLPQGYDTFVTADGANLSQGQRQLLAIARAAVADPPVLILDEATSSIDTRTERLIEKGMDSLMQGRTVFVIAHRLSTVRNANAILVLAHGRVVERGTHDELLAQKGMYYKLYHGMFELS